MTTDIFSPRHRAHADYLNLTLWTLQGWLAMFFIAAGYAKLTEPMDNLIALMSWPALVSESFVRGVGGLELVLALAVLAPLVSWRWGRLVLLIAAAGLAVIEAVMLGFHTLGADIGPAVVNIALLAITLPVLIGRRRPLGRIA